MSKLQNEIKIRSMCCGTLIVSTKGRVDKRVVVSGDLVTINLDSDTPQFHIYFRKKEFNPTTVNIK